MIADRSSSNQPTLQVLLNAYENLRQANEVHFPLNEPQRSALDSIVKTVEGQWFGQDRYNTPELRVAAILFFTIKNHPLTDGNKRTAVLAATSLAELNKLPPLTTERIGVPMSEIAVGIEKVNATDVAPEIMITDIATVLFPGKR